jgi:hypothetical protein
MGKSILKMLSTVKCFAGTERKCKFEAHPFEGPCKAKRHVEACG